MERNAERTTKQNTEWETWNETESKFILSMVPDFFKRPHVQKIKVFNLSLSLSLSLSLHTHLATLPSAQPSLITTLAVLAFLFLSFFSFSTIATAYVIYKDVICRAIRHSIY